MTKDIIKELHLLEQQKNIKVLYACESGSRAWGFPSPNSDYDVRFIYTHPTDWYLTLKEQDDVINLPISNDLDIGGWDIKKTLGLLWKSNAPLLEWIQSPIVYHQNDDFIKDIRSMGEQCFSPVSVMHHYLSMSKKYIERCNETDNVKLKHYFYAIRTIVACNWIRERKIMPQIELPNMFDIIDVDVRKKIIELIDIKATQGESYVHGREPIIDDFLAESLKLNDLMANDLSAGKGRFTELDNLFRKWVK